MSFGWLVGLRFLVDGSASAGTVEFEVSSEMVPVAGGYFVLEWVVTVTASGRTQIVPNTGAEEFFVEPRAVAGI